MSAGAGLAGLMYAPRPEQAIGANTGDARRLPWPLPQGRLSEAVAVDSGRAGAGHGQAGPPHAQSLAEMPRWPPKLPPLDGLGLGRLPMGIQAAGQGAVQLGNVAHAGIFGRRRS